VLFIERQVTSQIWERFVMQFDERWSRGSGPTVPEQEFLFRAIVDLLSGGPTMPATLRFVRDLARDWSGSRRILDRPVVFL